MRRLLLFAGFAMATAAGLIAQSAEKPPEDFVKAMKDLRAFTQAMTMKDAEFDFEATRPWVVTVRDAFGTVEKYWTDRNQEGKYFVEINTARDGTKAASDMGVAIALMSPEGIAASVKDIAGRCQACHEKRREKAADGGFLIKQ